MLDEAELALAGGDLTRVKDILRKIKVPNITRREHTRACLLEVKLSAIGDTATGPAGRFYASRLRSTIR